MYPLSESVSVLLKNSNEIDDIAEIEFFVQIIFSICSNRVEMKEIVLFEHM